MNSIKSTADVLQKWAEDEVEAQLAKANGVIDDDDLENLSFEDLVVKYGVELVEASIGAAIPQEDLSNLSLADIVAKYGSDAVIDAAGRIECSLAPED